MCDAIVLLAHGARDPEWALPIEAMAARLRVLLPAMKVVLAFLEFMNPDIDAAVTGLVAQGKRRISVVPVFLAQGGHVKRDVPAKLDALRTKLQNTNAGLVIDLMPAIGEQVEVIDAIATSVARIVAKP